MDEEAEIAEMVETLAEMALRTAGPEPQTIEDALSREDGASWHAAAAVEFEAMKQTGTWELVELPAGRKAVGCRWVFKIKKNADGTVERYKARIVAQGFAQKPHLEYTETFAPVARFASLRSVIAIAAIEDMELDQLDVSSAFLNGDLDEEIYMAQPPGFIQPGQEHLVCRLKKSIYGLKQSPRQWNKKLHETLLDLGFRRCPSEHSVYVFAKDGVKLIIPIYVDDLTLACNDRTALDMVKAELKKRFKMRDLGPCRYVIGIEVIRNRAKRTVHLSQRQHVEDVLAKFNHTNCRPVVTPLDPDVKLDKTGSPQTPEDVDYMSQIPYLSAVGSLMYLALGTRPDISYAVGVLSRFNSCPGRTHWNAVKRVFRYLRGTADIALEYGPSAVGVVASVYSDADYAGDRDRARSTTGFGVFIGPNLVQWGSRRQDVVAKSTTEAEYIAANEAASEAKWFRLWLQELGYPQTAATKVLIDNQSTIRVAKNPEHHTRMRHLDTKWHWLRDEVESGTFEPVYTETANMKADILTKALGTTTHRSLCEKLGLVRLDGNKSGSVEA
jgi:hypothetical protein